MYRVFLVDDEPIVLEGLRTVIEWENLGFTICGEAESGEQACGLLEKCRPDLVITDVMMAKMSGIELALYIGKNFPGTEIIIISGYDEFDFARSAMRAGVAEYILKPTKKEELEGALRKIAGRIQKRTDFEKSMRELRAEMKKNLPILRKQFYNDLANRAVFEEEEIIRRLKYYDSLLTGAAYRLWYFHLDRDMEYESMPEMRDLLYTQLEMLIRRGLGRELTFDFFVRGRELCCIVEEGKSEGEQRELLEELLGEFQNLTQNSVSVGVSRVYTSYSRLYCARRDCEMALEFQYNLGDGSCIFYDEVQSFSGGGIEYNYELLNKILMKLRAFNKKDVKLLIEKLYGELKENKGTYHQAYSQTVIILTELDGICGENKTQERIERLLGELHEYKTVDMLSALVLELADEVLDAAAASVAVKNEEIMKSAVRYVEEHLGEKISLADVADAVHLSKNYFCNIFKKEQGETFFSYLMRMRVEKAKKLLRTTEHKVYVIAEMVGYTDYLYFSQVFKKYVGVTASEYREIYDEE